MKVLSVLLVSSALAVSALGCELEGEAVAGTLDGRTPAVADVSADPAAVEGDANDADRAAHEGCPYLEHKAKYAELGCGGDEVESGCGGGCGGYEKFHGGGCGGGCEGYEKFHGSGCEGDW